MATDHFPLPHCWYFVPSMQLNVPSEAQAPVRTPPGPDEAVAELVFPGAAVMIAVVAGGGGGGGAVVVVAVGDDDVVAAVVEMADVDGVGESVGDVTK